MKEVITVIGEDQVGIVYHVSGILAEYELNILEITQTILDGFFSMILIAEHDGDSLNREELNHAFDTLRKELNLQIHIQNESLFRRMHQV